MKDELPEGIDIDDDAVRFSGNARWLLLTILKRAKFADDYVPTHLFNPWMAKLAVHLTAELAPTSDLQTFADDPGTRFKLARAIAYDAGNNGWWRMTEAERIDFLQSIVAAPHQMSEETVEEIMFAVEDEIASARRIVKSRIRLPDQPSLPLRPQPPPLPRPSGSSPAAPASRPPPPAWRPMRRSRSRPTTSTGPT